MNALKNIETDIETIGVSIDSREIEKDNLFIALVGENFDAHSKIQETLENGATLAIVNKDWYENNLAIAKDMPLIVVSDTLKAFHKLARFHRFRYDCNILAVAGSNGKTTTKEMISAILSKKFKILKTHKEFQ